jgi:hypothetical protein
MLRLCWESRCGDLEVPAGPIWCWSAYGHGEVYTPLVSSPEGKNWCECNLTCFTNCWYVQNVVGRLQGALSVSTCLNIVLVRLWACHMLLSKYNSNHKKVEDNPDSLI